MTRSVAEVIGCGHLHTTLPSMKGQTKTVEWRDGKYTPDDLLAWLLDRGYELSDAQYVKMLPDPVQYLVVVWSHSTGVTTSHLGPTLLAALERAVLAVAGES